MLSYVWMARNHFKTLLKDNLHVSFIVRWIALQDPTRSEMSRVMEEQKLNVGHGFAWSFYFGYLRLIIPGNIFVL